MRRREFIGLLGVATLWPLTTRPQQAERVRRVGVIAGANDQLTQARHAAFFQGLQQLGWTEGRNVHIDARWSAGNAAEIRRYALELVALAPDVIFTSGSSSMGACWRQPVRYRSYSRSFPIRSVPALSRACRGQAATRPAS